MWNLIVSVPDHCLSFYFAETLILTISSPKDSNMTFVGSRGFAELEILKK